MNDTNRSILSLFSVDAVLSSSAVYQALKQDKSISLVTIKRRLSQLASVGYLDIFGGGRSTKYRLSKKGLLLRPVDLGQYLHQDPDIRGGLDHYNFDLLLPPYVNLFDENEQNILASATDTFHANSIRTNSTIHRKELLRFIIEFSWKTSKIEGNTYDLLSTERLLTTGQRSKNHTEFESQMILNQKQALEFILADIPSWRAPNIRQIESLHQIVGKDLGIPQNIRNSAVGITGTKFKPIDNKYQIDEALGSLLEWISVTNNAHEKAFLAVVGTSYIQPFVDGNKRTARLLGNALLLAHRLAPLSYRSVDEQVYKEATLVFYEQNSLAPFKKLFIEQYVFTANNYSLPN